MGISQPQWGTCSVHGLRLFVALEINHGTVITATYQETLTYSFWIFLKRFETSTLAHAFYIAFAIFLKLFCKVDIERVEMGANRKWWANPNHLTMPNKSCRGSKWPKCPLKIFHKRRASYQTLRFSPNRGWFNQRLQLSPKQLVHTGSWYFISSFFQKINPPCLNHHISNIILLIGGHIPGLSLQIHPFLLLAYIVFVGPKFGPFRCWAWHCWRSTSAEGPPPLRVNLGDGSVTIVTQIHKSESLRIWVLNIYIYID